jgi:hypothetical protein
MPNSTTEANRRRPVPDSPPYLARYGPDIFTSRIRRQICPRKHNVNISPPSSSHVCMRSRCKNSDTWGFQVSQLITSFPDKLITGDMKLYYMLQSSFWVHVRAVRVALQRAVGVRVSRVTCTVACIRTVWYVRSLASVCACARARMCVCVCVRASAWLPAFTRV